MPEHSRRRPRDARTPARVRRPSILLAMAAAAMLAAPGAAAPGPMLVALCGGGYHRLPIPDRSPRKDCGKACHALCGRDRQAHARDRVARR